MQITEIRATPIRVPRAHSFVSSLGTQDHSEHAIVEVYTDEGIVGIGEASTIWGHKGAGAAHDIQDIFAPALIGMDPCCRRRVAETLGQLSQRSFPAKAAVDMALHDIVGKRLDTPVYDLLGGKVRDSLPLSRSLSMGPSQRVADQAEALAAEGYQTIKLKIGREHEDDLATMQAVRQRVGSAVTLRVDVNMGYKTAAEAVKKIQDLLVFDLELVEQPLHYSDLDGLRRVREKVNVPIMADESVWTPHDAQRCIQAGAADVLNVYVAEAGGLLAASEIFAIAHAAAVPCIIGSMPELGVGTAAQAHLAFAMSNIGFACDVNGFLYHGDDIICETLDIRGGSLYAPSGPGLGVTLDRDKLEKYRV